MFRCFFFLFFFAGTASADLVRYWTGNADDVRPRLHGPVLMLVGGGGDSTAALQEAIDRIRGCKDCGAKVDVVVLRASGADGYNPYFMEMNGVDSVLSMVITDRETSSRPDVVAAVRNAEVVYFAGGDQCNYIRWIKGTPVADAVKKVYRRGGAIGGTSAGLAIQGEIVYDACPSQSAQSKEVLSDPYHVDVSLSRGFFSWPEMRGVITDTHFQQRDRLGRLVTFLARSYNGRPLRGLGVSEGTVVLVDHHGIAKVFGEGPAHLIRGDAPARVEHGQPLDYSGLRIWRFETGETFDLRRWPEKAPKTIDVVAGKLSADPY
ncbi:MAG: cyanophycinase [Thermoanaerobaculia bacterium]